jgi:hypothetical protein
MRVTGAQVRAARAFLKWTIADLATAADVSISSIQVIESTDGAPVIKGGGVGQTLDHRLAARAEVMDKVTRALTKAGISFLPANRQGVGLRGKVD